MCLSLGGNRMLYMFYLHDLSWEFYPEFSCQLSRENGERNVVPSH